MALILPWVIGLDWPITAAWLAAIAEKRQLPSWMVSLSVAPSGMFLVVRVTTCWRLAGDSSLASCALAPMGSSISAAAVPLAVPGASMAGCSGLGFTIAWAARSSCTANSVSAFGARMRPRSRMGVALSVWVLTTTLAHSSSMSVGPWK